VISEVIDRQASGLNVRAAVQVVVAANVNETKEMLMSEKSGDYKPLTPEELSELAGEELPERAAMSLVNANVAIPINAAVAANVLSDNAVAYADAAQTGDIGQGN
jgi:hypothetical protein